MSEQPDSTDTTGSGMFKWHPEYAGKTFDGLHRELVDCIHRDQKAYQQALESAEKEEHGAFNTVRELEKRWSVYDFAWFELKPEHLADKILRFEQEREARREMISWEQWKTQSPPTVQTIGMDATKRDWRENLSDHQRKRIASALSILVIVGGLLFCIVLYSLIR